MTQKPERPTEKRPKAARKAGKKQASAEPTTLHPLDPKEVLRALLRTPLTTTSPARSSGGTSADAPPSGRSPAASAHRR